MAGSPLRWVERIVVLAAVVSAALLAAAELGFIPSKWSSVSLIVILLCLFVELAWRLWGLEASRDNMIARLIQSDLDTACGEMRDLTAADVRACLLRPEGVRSRSLMVHFSSSNMLTAADRGIRLEKWQGCSGKAWGHVKPVVADLTLPSAEGGPDWSMTPALLELSKEIKAVLSYPVNIPKKGSTLYGILSIDSKAGVAPKLASPQGLAIADRHSNTISAIIQGTW